MQDYYNKLTNSLRINNVSELKDRLLFLKDLQTKLEGIKIHDVHNIKERISEINLNLSSDPNAGQNF